MPELYVKVREFDTHGVAVPNELIGYTESSQFLIWVTDRRSFVMAVGWFDEEQEMQNWIGPYPVSMF